MIPRSFCHAILQTEKNNWSIGSINVRHATLVFASEAHTRPHEPALFLLGEALSCLELHQTDALAREQTLTETEVGSQPPRDIGLILQEDSHHLQAIGSYQLEAQDHPHRSRRCSNGQWLVASWCFADERLS